MFLQNRKIALTLIKPIELAYPRWYDPTSRYDYHVETIGHSIQNYLAFKSKVQSLHDAKWLCFKEMTETLNVTYNLLLNHNNPRVNSTKEGLKETSQ